MGTSTRRRTAPLLLVLALLLSSLGLVALGTTPAAAAPQGTVTGQLRTGGTVPVRMRWFTSQWQFLGERKVSGDIYSLSLDPGRYYVQFVDERPAYDIEKFAPTDIEVSIRSGRTIQRDVRMQPGAAITGTVRAGGRAAGGAEIVAAHANEQSFPVKADKQGRFALGGLPEGSYSLFTYDRTRTWVGRSLFVRGLRSGEVEDVAIALGTRAGSLRVELEAGGRTMGKAVFVTAVSTVTGQFWTTRASRGVAIFEGLHPGGYRMVAPSVGGYLAEEGPIRNARVRAGGADLVSTFAWTEPGASISGVVHDQVHPDFALAQVTVLALDAYGAEIGRATTLGDGTFVIRGAMATQEDVTLVIRPGGGNPPYLSTSGSSYCKFDSSELSGIDLVQGEEDHVGTLLLPQLPREQQDDRFGCGS